VSDAERIAPRDLFDRAAMTQRKRARQTALAKTLSGAPLPTPMADVDVDAFVDDIAGRVVERIAARAIVAPVDARPTSGFDAALVRRCRRRRRRTRSGSSR